MPTNKDFKRLVRRRMQKTGESYTSARAHLLLAPTRTRTRSVAARTPKPDYARLAGMSDAALQAATGCNWERWVKALDRVQAHTWPHRKIAEHVRTQYKTPDWWCQAVTVGYERIRGLRTIGQRRGGGFEASKSRTYAVPVAALYDAFVVDRHRSKWLPAGITVRKGTPHKSVRITWADGTPVEVFLIAKGAAKSTVQVQHRKLADQATAARAKEDWATRLESLGRWLGAVV